MAKNHITVEIKPDIDGMVEKVLSDNPEWFNKFNTGNTLEDFKPYDIVECTYSKGLYKVNGKVYGKLSVSRIDSEEEIAFIHPCFLKKISINNKLVKVLYGD